MVEIIEIKMKKNSTNRFYRIYRAILTRCNNPKAQYFHLYGGKGIECEWNTYEDFVVDMYKSYTDHVKKYGERETTIDRIDNSLNYCKENCRWATNKEQARNTSKNRIIVFSNKAKPLSEWAEITGISSKLILGRVDRLGWTIEKALTTPTGKLGTNQFSHYVHR